jgi:hypothetical protein
MKKATIKKDGYTIYRHAIIWKGAACGCALKYSSIGFGAADTLSGIKRLIKERTV